MSDADQVEPSGTGHEAPRLSVTQWMFVGGSSIAAALIIVAILATRDDDLTRGWWAWMVLALLLIVVPVGWAFHVVRVDVDARRLRIAVLTTGVTVAILAVTQITLSVNDQVRDAAGAECSTTTTTTSTTTTTPATPVTTDTVSTTPSGFARAPAAEDDDPDTATTDAPATTESTESDESDTTSASTEAASTAPGPSTQVLSPPVNGTLHVEEFGVERVVRTQHFIVAVAGDTTLTEDDFAVFGDDGRTDRAFATVGPVEDLGGGEWRVRVVFDVRCYSPWEGGTFPVTVAYRSAGQVAPTRWDASVALQSRIVVYGLAAIPWTMVLAIYLVFDVWPKGLKRWVGSLIGMVGVTVGAYAASGLRNQSWQPTIFNAGALLAVTWAAATAAAVVAKKGGYDLDDGSSVAGQASPAARNAQKPRRS